MKILLYFGILQICFETFYLGYLVGSKTESKKYNEFNQEMTDTTHLSKSRLDYSKSQEVHFSVLGDTTITIPKSQWIRLNINRCDTPTIITHYSIY